MSHLKEFFAVTVSGSLWHAEIFNEAEPYPSLVKLAQAKGSKASWGVGEKESSGMLAICQHLLLFIPEKYGRAHPMTGYEREPTMVNTFYWGPCTSPIVGLFLSEADARECLASNNFEVCDPRWKQSTIEVLRAVGKEHPCCSISTASGFSLMSPREWMP